MKGQTLFIRAIEPADAQAVGDFLRRHGRGSAENPLGFLGKLVGDLVAVLTIEMSERNIEIRELIVREDLRRKRIGRLMLDELERIAATTGLQSLRAQPNQKARPFFQKAGFLDEGPFMVRRVSRAER